VTITSALSANQAQAGAGARQRFGSCVLGLDEARSSIEHTALDLLDVFCPVYS